MKRMPTKRLLAALTVTTALVAGPAGAQLFSDWDWNEDGLLTEDEFIDGAEDEGLFGDWDDDADGMLDDAEFKAGIYSRWDRNNDGRLSVNEWDRGVDTWFGEDTVDLAVDNWDVDGNGIINRAEFRSAMDDVGLFAALEANRDNDDLIGRTGTRQATAGAMNRDRQQQARSGSRDRGNNVVALRSDWTYDNLRGGFSGENLMQADVHGRNGEEIGEVENIILGADNAIQSIIIEVDDGFLGFGGQQLAVPWNMARITLDDENDVDAIRVPITGDNVDQFSALGEYGYGLAEEEVALGDGISSIHRIGDEVDPAGGAWKASNLMGDYATLSDGMAYGYVDDLIFSDDGVLQAVVVEPDGDFGLGIGPFAYPFYGYDYGFDPVQDYYGLQYGYDDAAGLDAFDYGYLDPGL